ncbi:MAG: hypothetical protein ABF267_00235 [Glaciecola sp.]
MKFSDPTALLTGVLAVAVGSEDPHPVTINVNRVDHRITNTIITWLL